MRILKGLAALLLLAGLVPAQQVPVGGIDRSYFDPTCKPCEDFWRYADGGWLDRNPIPARLLNDNTLIRSAIIRASDAHRADRCYLSR